MKDIHIEVTITESDIENALCSAATGSRYWCENASDLGYDSTLKRLWSTDGRVELIDGETGEKHFLTLAKLEAGLKVMQKTHVRHFNDILSGDTDETTGDVLLQCALFDDVIYS